MKNKPMVVALLVSAAFATSGAAWADKPSWAGKGKPESRQDERHDGNPSGHFSEDSRRILSDYYGRRAKAGKCPPGLAKKNNGCLPPGQAKKWAKGQPLPHDVRYHDLPRELLKRLPPPPPKHRYVQVAQDILLIAVGTSMVVDAVEDILR